MARKTNDPLRTHLLELLSGEPAHIGFGRAVAGLKLADLGKKLPNMPHSVWDLVDHMRIKQADILAFTCDARHESPKWPEGYWPTEPATPARWKESIEGFKKDRDAFIAIVENPKTGLLSPLPYGDGQTVAREAILLVDHTAYHLGQLIVVRRGLGIWED